jgi:hypothetical protein
MKFLDPEAAPLSLPGGVDRDEVFPAGDIRELPVTRDGIRLAEPVFRLIKKHAVDGGNGRTTRFLVRSFAASTSWPLRRMKE